MSKLTEEQWAWVVMQIIGTIILGGAIGGLIGFGVAIFVSIMLGGLTRYAVEVWG